MWSSIILYWPPPPPPKLIYNNQISILAGTVSRKIFDTRDSTVDSIPYDHDENKYQRRGAIDWFTRWFWWVLNPSWLQAIAANHLMSARSSVLTRSYFERVFFWLMDGSSLPSGLLFKNTREGTSFECTDFWDQVCVVMICRWYSRKPLTSHK